MSSKKIFKCVGFEEEMLARLKKDSQDNEMSLGMVVRNIVREHYGKQKGEKNANQGEKNARKETADRD